MTDVVMPQMGESIVEGTLTKWLKKPGDTVAADEPLFEISTDKVDTEIPSPAAGVLAVTQESPIWAAIFVWELARPPLWLFLVFLLTATGAHGLNALLSRRQKLDERAG